MTEQEYLGHLEMRVSRELAGMPEKHLRRMWCDGFIPEKFVVTNSGSHLAGRVWIANRAHGQTPWNFVLLLGRDRVSWPNVNWAAMLPAEDATGWLYMDSERQFLKIKLSAARSDCTAAVSEPALGANRGGHGLMMLPTDDELSGMTTNERLYACGLLSQFDDAARRRDRATMIGLLSQVKGKDYSDEQAARAVDDMLTNPAKFFEHLGQAT